MEVTNYADPVACICTAYHAGPLRPQNNQRGEMGRNGHAPVLLAPDDDLGEPSADALLRLDPLDRGRHALGHGVQRGERLLELLVADALRIPVIPHA